MTNNKRPQYLVLAGIGILTIVVLILLASPSSLVSPTVTVIGNNLHKTESNEISVKTRTDFSNPEQIKSFPYDIGKWHGMDYDTTEVVRSLGANYAFIRGYDPETFNQPIFLTVVQSKTNSSFHTLEGCLALQGFQFQENSRDSLTISSPIWTQGNSSVTIPLNRLVVTKNKENGDVYERSVVLFFYVKGNQFYSDMITLVEVQALVPIRGSYEGTLNEEKAFLSAAIPLMFEPTGNSAKWHPLITSMAEKGAGGYAGITVMFLIPLVLIIYPLVRRRGTSK